MKRKDFEALIIKAIEALPARIREKIKNVVFTVEKYPGKKMPCKRKVKSNENLLGLYEGVPLTAWGRDYSGELPDKITFFQEPIEVFAGRPEQIPALVRETVWHEIGHYFGFDEPHIRKLDKKWGENWHF